MADHLSTGDSRADIRKIEEKKRNERIELLDTSVLR